MLNVLVPTLLLTGQAFAQDLLGTFGAPSLRDAYNTAVGYSKGFRIIESPDLPKKALDWQKGHDPNTVYLPPEVLNKPPNIPPPPPTDAKQDLNLYIERKIKDIQEKIGKQTRRKQVWMVALEKLREGDANWREELEYWANASQVFQLGAVITVGRLLGGALGPLRAAIEVHGYNATFHYKKIQELEPRLSQVKALLENASKHTKETQEVARAVEELTKQYNELVSLMRREIMLRELFDLLYRINDRTMNVGRIIGGLSEATAKQDLLLAQMALQNMIVDMLKEAGLDRLEEWLARQRTTGAGYTIKLANFIIDYSYYSFGFYKAWAHTHLVLSEIEDKNLLATQMGIRIKHMTDDIKELKDRLQRLNTAKGTDDYARKSWLLNELRAVENYKAWLAGEWFSQQTGWRAPGRPINGER